MMMAVCTLDKNNTSVELWETSVNLQLQFAPSKCLIYGPFWNVSKPTDGVEELVVMEVGLVVMEVGLVVMEVGL
jgi:hypothetical protein